MADNNQSIRYDDFISHVHPDPAKPEATIMLSGYIGHGPEGRVRIYSDPTLSTWYDVAEADVVHTTPLADSKLGGSYVWVRASAQMTPGLISATEGAAAPGAAPAAAVAQPADVPMPTPATRCFVCPPLGGWQTHQASICIFCPHAAAPAPAQPAAAFSPLTICFGREGCPPQSQFCTQVGCAPGAIHPTPSAVTLCCPPHVTVDTLCTQLCTQIYPACGGWTLPVVCGVLPPSIGCTQHGCLPGAGGVPGAAGVHAAAAAVPAPVPNTAATLCTQDLVCQGAAGMQPTPATRYFICPPLTQDCTAATVCTAPNHCVQPTPTAHLTLATVCTQLCTHPQFGCAPPITQPVACGGLLPPSLGGCTQQSCVWQCHTQAAGCTGAVCLQAGPHAVAAAAVQPTPTVQTRCFVCPPHQTLDTLCTLPPGCPPFTAHICPTPSAVQHCGGTIATVCTQPVVCAPGRTGVFTPYGG